MKRFLASVVSLALILLTPPPAAWAQFAEAARAGIGSAPTAGAQAATVRLGASASIPALGNSASLAAPSFSAAPSLNAPAATGALGAPALAPAVAPALTPAAAPSVLHWAAGQRPFEHKVVVSPVVVPNAVPSGANAAAANPVVAVEGAAAPESAAGLTETAKNLAAPEIDPALALERLFTGADARPELNAGAPALDGKFGAAMSGLEPASFHRDQPGQGFVPDAPRTPNGRGGSKFVGFLKSVGTIALAAGAAVGLQALGVALAPALFSVVPVAAVWAVSSGVLLFPAALYARYRLSKRDSPRLNKVKVLMDAALGLYIGALVVAAPSLSLVLTGAGILTAVLPAAGLAAGMAARGAPFLNSVMVWGALGLTPLAVGAAAVGGIALAPVLGMLALPAMTTIAFFLGTLITSAETGRPFSVPGSIQKMRFPSFQWVMIGVVFALLTGYSAVHTNLAFLAWNFLGSRAPAPWDKRLPLWKNLLNKAMNFDVLYLGLLAFTAIGGFTSPLTFLVLAFSGERAAVWTERLLGRFLPKAAPSPSTTAIKTDSYAGEEPAAWPKYHYWAKTYGIIAAMAGIGLIMSLSVFGIHSLLMSAIPAVLLAAVPFWFATKIIKLVMHDAPADEHNDPEFFAIMRGLRDKINARRATQGKKEIPMPEMVNDPLPLPNAYATGRSPFHALVGVTAGIKEMTLDPENVREGVARLMANAKPGTKSFKVFRLAIAGSISGVTEQSSPADVQAAVLKADRVELKALGVRMLTGVLGHEFSHVMDRHMLSGAIAGAVSSSIAFASYGVMWAVGHAQVAGKKLMDKILGRRAPAPEPSVKGDGEEGEGGNKTLVADPISIGVAVKSLPALLKLFAALWVPVLVQIVQMASSRNNEGMADEDGALLSEDPQSLALALGLLTTWRPKTGFTLSTLTLPRVIALSHMMTVNPLQQAQEAGAMPKLDAFTEAVVGKGDDFLFDLFVTHPDTLVRIEKLSDMADALRAAKPARPKPPTGEGGGGKPLAFVPPGTGTAPATNGGGLFRGARAKLTKLLRVLPDEGRNRAFWHYTIGQALTLLGAEFHYTALPGIVAPTKADAPKLGYNRAINWSAQAASSLATGPVVDRNSVKPTLVWTYFGRTALMAAVPLLVATGHFGFAAFSLIIGLAGFLQATSQTAGAVAFNRILGDDEAHYNRANAIATIVTNLVGVAGPLIAGGFIAWMGTLFAAPLMGGAMAYAVYAVFLLATGVGYSLFLKIPRDDMIAARRELLKTLKDADLGGPKLSGVSGGKLADGRAALLVEVRGDPAEAKGLPAEFAGYPVRAIARRNPAKELLDGFKLAWSSRFLRLYMLLSTLSIATGDSLVFAVMPRYLAEIVKAGAGSFGLFLAASAAGLGLASAGMSLLKDPAQSALAPIAAELRADTAARAPALDGAALDRAAAAVRGALPALLERYRDEWTAGRGVDRAPERFADELVAEASAALGRALGVPAASGALMLSQSGAEKDLRLWAILRSTKFLAKAKNEGTTGMDALSRQGRATNWLHALSWIAYAGVFLAHSLWPSVGLMLLSALLAGPATVVWSSLTTRAVSGRFPNDQGKVYSALTFYMLVFSVVGTLAFGWMMSILPTVTAVLVAVGALGVCTLFDLLQSWKMFPLDKRDR